MKELHFQTIQTKKTSIYYSTWTKTDFRKHHVLSDGYKPKHKFKILSDQTENSKKDSKRRKCSRPAPSAPDTQPSPSELNELVGMVKSLANEFEVKEIKQKQNEVQMPKLEKAPTPITVQLSLVPGFHMPNFFPPAQR